MLKQIKELGKKYTVLLVEDEATIRENMKMLLEMFFKKVITASNGSEAVEIFQNENIDIVITDIKMPKMDGIELTKYLKSFDPSLPIIIITATSESSELIELIRSGADYFLLKPIEEEQFLDTLFKTLQNLYNKELQKEKEKEIRKKEIKSIIISILDFIPYPLYATEKGEIFFINDMAFDENLEYFEGKEILKDIKIYRKKG